MPPKFIRNYWSKITHNDSKNSLLVKNYQYHQKLFYLLAGDGVDAVAAEDEDLAITEDF